MAKMKTLTVSGQTYTVNDPEAVSFVQQTLTSIQQQTARENIGACTEESVCNKLCPAFTESGPTVTCAPVEGYPLKVVSSIEPGQSGTAEPSPENVRPISGHSIAKLTQENGTDAREITADLGQIVYGGSFDWATGELVSNMVCLTLTGDEDWLLQNGYARLVIGECGYVDAEAPQLCSHFKIAPITSGTTHIGADIANSTAYNDARIRIRLKTGVTLAESVAFLKEQYANGTPVQICFGVANPTTTKLAAQEILALSGTNTLRSDTGDTEVKGRADPVSLLGKLTEAVLSLGGSI